MKGNDLKEFITPIDSRNLVEKAEMELLRLFIKYKLKPGDLIPKETDLCAMMVVSRTVIRETLNRLKTLDILESVKHKGTVIKSPNLLSSLQKIMIPNILSETTLKDMFELRMIIEIGMSDFIFQHITSEDIDCLGEIVSSEPERSDSLLFDIQHEVNFHGKLYEITGNKFLIEFQLLLLPLFSYTYDSGLINKSIKRRNYVSHKGIVEVLRNGDAKIFREAMRAHLENHFLRIFG